MEFTDAELYEKYADDLIRFATGIVGPHDAADALSTAVLSAMASPAWADVRNKRAYLYRSVYNAAQSMQRSGGRRRVREERFAPAEAVHPTDLQPEVWAAVDQLSVRQRAVVFLTYWEDLEVAAVAEMLDIGAGSVKRHLARARANLRKSLS